MGAQRYDLSSYARLWRLNRHKKDLSLYARLLRPISVEIFRFSGHMINCLLTKFGWAGRENIWLSVMKQGPRCAPTTQLISTQYFCFYVTLLSLMM